MKEIVKVTSKGNQVVDARRLHKELESKKDFSSWIKAKVVNNPIFVENEDFTLLTQKGEQKIRGGHNKKDYALTLNTAKQVALMENTEKGRKIRLYFIECENKLIGNRIPQTFAEALRLAADKQEALEKANLQIEQEAPKVLFANSVETSKRSVLIGELAKIITQNGIKIGQNKLFKWLRGNGFLCSYGEKYNEPTQRAMEMGLFELKKTTINKPNGDVIVSTTPKVSGKGQIYFVNKFLSRNELQVKK